MLLKINIMKIIYSFIEILAVAFFIAMMGAMIIQVISRYLLNSPISWIEECARFLFIWMIYCGAIISMKKRLFYKVDYFAEHLPNKLKIIFNFLVQISVLLALLFLFIYSNKTVYAFRAVKSVALHLPWKYIYFSLSFSVFFMIVISLFNIKKFLEEDLLKVLRKKTEKNKE